MPMMRMDALLRDAAAKKQGIASFNVFNLESIAWAIEAAQLEQMPVICMLYPGMKNMLPFDICVKIIKSYGEKASVPVAMHLDHSVSLPEIQDALDAGFDSVLFDGSKLSYEENVRLTQQVVKMAHAAGACVEAELGMVGSASVAEHMDNTDYFTKPEEAKAFVAATGVDVLAVAIGNAHGFYTKEPKLDFGLLAAIADVVKLPLVMHGGTGIPDSDLAKAVSLGMSKFNFGTIFFNQYPTAIKAAMEEKGSSSYPAIFGRTKEITIQMLRDRIAVLKGSEG